MTYSAMSINGHFKWYNKVSDQLTYCHSKTLSVIHEVSIQCVELFEGHAVWANTVFTTVTIPMCPLQPVIHTVM